MNNIKTFIDKLEKLNKPLELKIFFCFSDETRSDVESLKLELSNVSQQNAECFNIHLRDWSAIGELDLHNVNKEIQDFYDKEIRKSDFVIFLFHNEWGVHTKHEWELCMSNIQKRPKILLGFRQDKNSLKTPKSIRKELNSENKIIDTSYSEVKEFSNVILKAIVERLNSRKKYISRMLNSYKNENLISPIQAMILSSKLDNYTSTIKQVNVNFRTSPIHRNTRCSRESTRTMAISKCKL